MKPSISWSSLDSLLNVVTSFRPQLEREIHCSMRAAGAEKFEDQIEEKMKDQMFIVFHIMYEIFGPFLHYTIVWLQQVGISKYNFILAMD